MWGIIQIGEDEIFPYLHKDGGVDGIRTRDPRRDRPIF